MVLCSTSLGRAGLRWTLLGGTGLCLLLLVVHLIPGLGSLALLQVCWTRLRLDRTGRNIFRFAFLLRYLHFLVLALRISFPGHVVEEVDAVRANQVDWTLALDQGQLGIVGNQYVDIGLKIIAALHGQYRNLHLLLVVALRLDLNYVDLILLGGRHQDCTLDEQLVRRSAIFFRVFPLLSRVLGSPRVLLLGSGQVAAPQKFLRGDGRHP